jgi:hypothetical protein
MGKIAVAVVVVFFVGGAVAACLSIANYYLLVYPTPENQSVFYQTYNPDPILQAFSDSRHIVRSGEASEAAAGRHAATIHRLIENVFVLQGLDHDDLVRALSDDVRSRLIRSGTYITEMTPATDGFQFRYVERNGTGTVVLKPMEIVDPHEVWARSKSHPECTMLPPLPAGALPIKVTIAVDETWSRPRT